MITAQDPPNVFLLHVTPQEGLTALDVEHRMIAQAREFAPASRPSLPSSLLSHRILRRDGGGLVWEISFEGVDVPDPSGDDSSFEPLAEALAGEVRARLAGFAEVDSVAAFSDVLRPAPDRGFSQTESAVQAFGDDAPGWEAYAEGSGEPEAGTPLPQDLLDMIAQSRASLPGEPSLKPYGKGHQYTGNTDKRHIEYLKAYLSARAAKAGPADRRKILAFLAFQSREGSTAAINTYDNQIVTWGTGWGGLGWLGAVVGRAVSNEALRDALGRAGVRYRGKSTYDVVDLDKGAVVTGKQPALEVMRRSVPLLNLLIDVARDAATRDAATEAQLLTFMGGSANISGADAIATQALFNFITHLRHWADGYAAGCLEWAVSRVSGSPSPERDVHLAVLVARYFYGKARTAKGSKWIPDWRQLKLYVQHMKQDGLDCMAEPFFRTDSPPDENPFAAAPATPAAAAPAAAPVKAAMPAASAPPAKAAMPDAPSPAPPATPPKTGLKNLPLAGEPMLEAVAAGKATLHRGVHGDAVKALQQALMALALEVPGGADGAFGGGLERALKAFQGAHGLSADGVVGRGTLSAVDAALGARNKSLA